MRKRPLKELYLRKLAEQLRRLNAFCREASRFNRENSQKAKADISHVVKNCSKRKRRVSGGDERRVWGTLV